MEFLEAAAACEDRGHNLIRRLRTLRVEINHELRRQPVMASGLTDHIWTVKELLMPVLLDVINTK